MSRAQGPTYILQHRSSYEAFWQQRKKKFILVVVILGLALQVLFTGNLSYLYGSLWRSSERYHNFNVLYIDYDGGVVGQSVTEAYQRVKGSGFPTFIQQNGSQYPALDDVIEAVKDNSYWAAFLVNRYSSNRLLHALQGGEAALNYNASEVITYIWNEVRYPAFSDQIFEANFMDLVGVSRLVYNEVNGRSAVQSMNPDDNSALQVLLNPIMASAINIMPTTQATRLLYNGVSMAMPVLWQFFFLLILNGISDELQLYARLPVRVTGLLRVVISLTFTLVAGLCQSGYIWAYRESWHVDAKQFVLTWMVFWLLMHIHFLILDTFTAFLPLPAIPFFILTWIFPNITSTVSPFEINPSFYRWGYALPANEAYTTLTDIWSAGSVPQLHLSLPVMFSWWVVGISLATIGHFHRCRKAKGKLAEAEEAANPSSPKRAAETVDYLPPLRTSSSVTLLNAAESVYQSVYNPYSGPSTRLFQSHETPESQSLNNRDSLHLNG